MSIRLNGHLVTAIMAPKDFATMEKNSLIDFSFPRSILTSKKSSPYRFSYLGDKKESSRVSTQV
jgi:hypothetical protein